MLTKEQTQQLGGLLQVQERNLRAKIRSAIHERAGRDTSELSASGGDDSEQSIADLLESIDTDQLNHEGSELIAIDVAKESLKAGTYGTCCVCQGPIEYKRLLALPTAQRCLPCQENLERAEWKGPGAKL